MKITKQQLQKIIQEELSAMQQEGDLEEGVFDRLFGRSSEFSDLASTGKTKEEQELSSEIINAQNSLKQVARIAANKNPELNTMALSLADKLSDMSKLAKMPDEKETTTKIQQGIKRIPMNEPGYEKFKNLRDDIKNALDSGTTPPELSRMIPTHNKLVPKEDEIDLNMAKRKEELEHKPAKGKRQARVTYEYRKAIAKHILSVLDQALIDPTKYGQSAQRGSEKARRMAQQTRGVNPRE